jgi:RimJ/RimL family protein N-acetyltransferase
MITGERKQSYLDFSNLILGATRSLATVKMIADVDENDKPQAVVLFTNFNNFNMELSIASKPKWQSSRRFFKEVFNYAFNTCGAWRCTVVINETNVKSLDFCARLGFEMENEGRLKHFFGEHDGFLMVMHKDKCKWIRGKK